jgi:hypothetical protein
MFNINLIDPSKFFKDREKRITEERFFFFFNALVELPGFRDEEREDSQRLNTKSSPGL